MSMTDDVHAIISDGQGWTAGEIARAMVDRCDVMTQDYRVRYYHVCHALYVLEKWGKVKRDGKKPTINNQTATVWVVVS